MTVFGMFPGQGSQVVGMGKDFAEFSDEAGEFFNVADRALGFSLSKLCFEGPIDELTLTQNAQPAILTVSVIAFNLSRLELSAAAGHSLGEYSALVAAGVLKFEEAVALVYKRGRYMQEAVPAGQGKMLAVMGPTEAEILEVAGKVECGVVEIANLNSAGQIVVAGDAAGIEAFAPLIQAKGAKVIPLNVSAPFHCRLMKPAQEKLSVDLNATSFAEPRFPVYSNVEAKPINSGSQARELLKKQVCASVRWTDIIENSYQDLQYDTAVEFGAGAVLSKLLKRSKPQVSRREISNMSSLKLEA